MSPQALIQVEHLYRYYGEIRAVEDLSFDLNKGDVLGFLGPNGAGKSTTMQVISGNLAPTAGQVTVNGVDLLDEPKRAKAGIGYLPEQPPLYRELTVDEYLRYCARLNRIPRARVAQAVLNAKARCGLEQMGRRLIANLSKGYQQRVGIAQAIIHTPDVVILDEPTIGLDPIQIREIRDLIRDIGREHGVILSTHILPEVQAVCSRVQIIHEGRLVFAESLTDLDRRMAPTSLIVRLREPPTDEALTAIDGVERVERLDDGAIRIHHAAERNPAEPLARHAVNEGWGLRELTPERISLEQMFMDLTLKSDQARALDEEAA